MIEKRGTFPNAPTIDRRQKSFTSAAAAAGIIKKWHWSGDGMGGTQMKRRAAERLIGSNFAICAVLKKYYKIIQI